MSTTFEIGRWPAAISRAFSHGGLGPIVTFSNTLAVKRGHSSFGVCTVIVMPAELAVGSRGRVSTAAGSSGAPGGGVDLPRDAVDREAVGPVRRDLELEHVGGDREDLFERGSGFEAVVVRGR